MKLLRIVGLLLLCTLGSNFASGNRIQTQVFLHTGLIVCSDSVLIPAYSFALQNQFNQKQGALRIRPGDSLVLQVFNLDSLAHRLGWQVQKGASVNILPGTSAELLFFSSTEGLDYLIDVSGESWRYMGLSLPVMILEENKQAFLWNISEKSASFSQQLVEGQTADFDTYDPEYFFINGVSNPQTLSDSLGRVEGIVGDSIHIFIINSGMAAHSIHFHGFHLKILFSSAFPDHNGRSKDTFPILKGEVLNLLLIPDKPGEYPVHDHNLIAVSGGGIYPNGMFTTLLIH